jgi:hypothetical protein
MFDTRARNSTSTSVTDGNCNVRDHAARGCSRTPGRTPIGEMKPKIPREIMAGAHGTRTAGRAMLYRLRRLIDAK